MIDLRSDTVTQPSKAMREDMLAAEVGDDVYGEDPEILRLEQDVAKLFSKEAALFVPSGTMGNAIALNVHCSPGDSVVIEEKAHCMAAEAGGAAALSGLQFQEILLTQKLSAEGFARAVQGETLQAPTSTLFVLENTHNFSGGCFYSAHEVALAAEIARSYKLKLHCDGARIWNAHIASGDSLSDLAKPFDSITVCFSKGLGAPVGSALMGSTAFITKARKVRKRLGGGMRQAGFLARAARYAMEHHIPHLAIDHKHAQDLATQLNTHCAHLASVKILFPERATNMVYFQCSHPDTLIQNLKEERILISHLGRETFRCVFHRDISPFQAAEATEKLISVLLRLDKEVRS